MITDWVGQQRARLFADLSTGRLHAHLGTQGRWCLVLGGVRSDDGGMPTTLCGTDRCVPLDLGRMRIREKIAEVGGVLS